MFSRTKVASRLAVAFGFVLLLLLAVVGLGISRLNLINESLRTITEENIAEATHALAMRSAAYDSAISIRNMLLYTDPAKTQQELNTLDVAFQAFESEHATLSQMFAAIPGTTRTENDWMPQIQVQWTPVRS